jgi:hypothetical protein
MKRGWAVAAGVTGAAILLCAAADGLLALVQYGVYDRRGLCQSPHPYSECGTRGLVHAIVWTDAVIVAVALITGVVLAVLLAERKRRR